MYQSNCDVRSSTLEAAEPNFLLIGAQKCATSWLANMIRQHPDVFAPLERKELHFFDKAKNYSRGIQWYRKHFVGYAGERAVGEFTPDYFWVSHDTREHEAIGRNAEVPRLVHDSYPDMKFILCLRNPTERAISAYYHHIRMRRISPKDPIRKVCHKYGIITMGFYYYQLYEWLRFFPLENFLILIYEYDILENRKETLRRIYSFLGVDESFWPSGLEERFNTRSGHLYLWINYLSPRLARTLCSMFPALRRVDLLKQFVGEKEIKGLSYIYTEENRKLESLLGIDLSVWNDRQTPSRS